MRIGIIGAGKIGATVGKLWIGAGHQVCFGSRNPERLAALVAGLEAGASAGSMADAAQLVRDAGFDPVIAGPLVQAAEFDVGAPAYNNPQTAQCLERTLALQPPG